MSEVKPARQGPVEAKQLESQPPRAEPPAPRRGLDLAGVLKIAGSLIAAIAALLTALNGADWLRPSAPAPSPAPTITRAAPASATPVSTIQATATLPAPTATKGRDLPEGTLLVEDFSDPASGWEVEATDEYELAYLDGEYGIIVHVPDIGAWGRPLQDYEFGDFVVEADARQVAGPEDGDYGLVVRSSGDTDFYLFAVNSQYGMYSVQVSRGEEWADLAEWAESPAVRQGDVVNHLKVECLGTTMRFYANGELLTEVTDSTYRSGNVGLLAETFDAGGVEVRFDNVRVQVLKRF